jgi:hypothetical protein
MNIRAFKVSTTALLCLLLAGGLSACERDKGPAAQGPAPGSVSRSLTARLPSDWPSQVPTYPGGKIVTAGKLKTGDMLVQQTEDPPAKVVDFYKAQLSQLHLVKNVDKGAAQSLTWSDDAQPPLRVSLSVGTNTKTKATFANVRVTHAVADEATEAPAAAPTTAPPAAAGQAGAAAQ